MVLIQIFYNTAPVRVYQGELKVRLYIHSFFFTTWHVCKFRLQAQRQLLFSATFASHTMIPWRTRCVSNSWMSLMAHGAWLIKFSSEILSSLACSSSGRDRWSRTCHYHTSWTRRWGHTCHSTDGQSARPWRLRHRTPQQGTRGGDGWSCHYRQPEN